MHEKNVPVRFTCWKYALAKRST